MKLTPESILWIKNINAENGAYLDEEGEFRLHFPNNHKENAALPEVGDAILLYQRMNNSHAFTHIVTPINGEVKEENGRTKFKYYREVKVLAKKTESPFIKKEKTLFREVSLRGVSQGNVCRLGNMKSIYLQELLKEIQLEIYAIFLPETEEDKDETDSDEQTSEEGNKILLKHYSYERNRKIVLEKKAQAIREGILYCEVCGFSFCEVYGEEYIECHHLTPLGADIVRNTKLEDLSLVCSNCHRMLHRKTNGEYRQIEQMRISIRNR